MSTSNAADSPHESAEFVLSRREKVFTLIGTLLALLLAALDQTIVATAGPAMQRDLHIPASLYPWITTAYLVASVVMVPIYGKLSDLYGRKPILLSGIGIFLLGSLACGVSRETFQLIASRALQGVGSAALFTSAFAVAADMFAPAERGKYQGIFGACFALSSVIGPLIGGFLTDNLSWHWVFFVNLPLGIAAATFIVLRMPMLRRARTTPARIDYAGAVCLLASVVPFLIALSLGREAGPDPRARPLLVGLVALSAVSLAGFLFIEGRAADPLLDLRLFKNRTFAFGNLSTFILGAAFLGAIVFLPLFMVNVVGVSATSAGFTLTPLTFGIVGGNVISGQIVSRVQRYKPLMMIGNAILFGGYALLAFTLSPESSQAEVTLKMVVLGLGLGPTIPLYTLAIQNAVSARDIGVATASATFSRQIGSTMGVSVLGLVFAMTLASESQKVTEPPELRAAVQSSNSRPTDDTARSTADAPGGVRMRVDVAHYREAVTARYASDPRARDRALEALSAFDRDTKRAFARSIAAIYRAGLLIVVLGALTTLMIAEIPLRRAEPPRNS